MALSTFSQRGKSLALVLILISETSQQATRIPLVNSDMAKTYEFGTFRPGFHIADRAS